MPGLSWPGKRCATPSRPDPASGGFARGAWRPAAAAQAMRVARCSPGSSARGRHSGCVEPPAARSRYLADIARAESYLEAATAAAGNQGLRSQLTVLSTGVPVYTGLVETARSDNQQGLPVGAAYLGEASYLMRTRLLPAAKGLYTHENARLT